MMPMRRRGRRQCRSIQIITDAIPLGSEALGLIAEWGHRRLASIEVIRCYRIRAALLFKNGILPAISLILIHLQRLSHAGILLMMPLLRGVQRQMWTRTEAAPKLTFDRC